MAKIFSDIFVEAWNEYLDNFKVFFILILLFMFIPTLILSFLNYPLTLELNKLGPSVNPWVYFSTFINYPYLPILSIFSIVSLFLSVFLSAALISCILYKKKNIKLKDAIESGKKYFWSYLGFLIVILIFLLGLSLALIVPAIVFGVYWIFSVYYRIGEKKGILNSLESSFNLVRGRWWKTFGYLLLLGIIMLMVIFGFSGIFFIINLIALSIYNSFIVGIILSNFHDFIINLIIAPIGILFFKNLYLEYKARGTNRSRPKKSVKRRK